MRKRLVCSVGVSWQGAVVDVIQLCVALPFSLPLCCFLGRPFPLSGFTHPPTHSFFFCFYRMDDLTSGVEPAVPELELPEDLTLEDGDDQVRRFGRPEPLR